MTAIRVSTVWRGAAATFLVCAIAGVSAMAQETASSLDASEAAEYIGVWEVTMEFGTLTLTFKDMEGKLGAVMVSEQDPTPQTIDTITKTDEGLKLEFDSDFGRLIIDLDIRSGALEGTLSSEDGGFSIELSGKKAEFGEGDEAGRGNLTREQRRALARRRRGPAISKADFGGKNVQVAIGKVPTDGPDFAELASVASGSVARYTVSSAIKMMTDTDLAFGDLAVEKENFAENYPGVYSLWLKKVDDGWHLVFNEKPDVWGTQHDPAADVGEVALRHEVGAEPTENLECTISKEGEVGTLKIAWGPNVWSTQFKAISP